MPNPGIVGFPFRGHRLAQVLADLKDVAPDLPSDGQIIRFDATRGLWVPVLLASSMPVVGAEWGDALAASPLTADSQTPQFRPVPWPHEIIAAYAWASPAGNVSFEIRRQNAGIPDSADKISGTDPVALSGAAYVEKTSFTGWSLTGAADDVYGFVPSGEATAKLIGVALVLRRTD